MAEIDLGCPYVKFEKVTTSIKEQSDLSNFPDKLAQTYGLITCGVQKCPLKGEPVFGGCDDNLVENSLKEASLSNAILATIDAVRADCPLVNRRLEPRM